MTSETSSETHEAALAEVLERDPAVRLLGIQVQRASAGRVTLELPPRPETRNSHGIVHGGYVFLLADTAFAYCCMTLGRVSATRNADVSFLQPGDPGDTLIANARMRSQHQRITICDVSIESSSGGLLAEFRGYGALLRTATAAEGLVR